MTPDYGRVAEDYAAYRARFPDELYSRLERHGIGAPGSRILDLGTGTGNLIRPLAQRGCEVTGLDPSRALLSKAKDLDAEAGVSVRYVLGRAEETCFRSNSWDVVSAGVCWHWFDAPRAAAEIRRILVPGGRLAIVHFEWLSCQGGVARATERLMRDYRRFGRIRSLITRIASAIMGRLKPEWGRSQKTGIHPDRLTTLARAGFENLQSFSFVATVNYTHAAWRGRIRSHAQVGATMSQVRVEQLDRELAGLLEQRFPESVLEIPHRVFVVLGRAPMQTAMPTAGDG